MMFTRGFSLTNFIIGTSALSFQVFVLFPWHEQLQKDFEDMRKEHLALVREAEDARQKDLSEIRSLLQQMKRR